MKPRQIALHALILKSNHFWVELIILAPIPNETKGIFEGDKRNWLLFSHKQHSCPKKKKVASNNVKKCKQSFIKMALNDKGEESLMRIKEPQKREKCPLKVTQLQRLNGLSFSAARVPALHQACYPQQDPVTLLWVTFLPHSAHQRLLSIAGHQGDDGHITLDLVSVSVGHQGSRSSLSHPILYCRACCHSVMSDSLWPHGLQPTRLLCPWDSPGKSGVGCRFLLQGIIPNPGIEPGSPVTPALPGRLFTT